MSHISILKKLTTGRPVGKTLIKYSSNILEENEEEKEPIDIEFPEQKADPEMMKMLLTLNDQMYKKKTRKILLCPTSLNITKASLWWNFFKQVFVWLFDNCSITPNEKKNY